MRSQLSVLVFALLGAVGVEGHARWKCPAPRDENDANGKALCSVGGVAWPGVSGMFWCAVSRVLGVGGSVEEACFPDSMPGSVRQGCPCLIQPR